MTTRDISASSFLEDLPACRVVDVRTPEEFAARRLPGSENIPLNQLDSTTCLALADSGEPLYLLCGTGMRAGKAHALLAEHTACTALVVEGGIAALQEHGVELAED